MQWPYTIAMKHYDWVKNEINKLFNVQVICSSHSSWSAPIIVVPKGDKQKMPSHWLQGSEQSHMEGHVAHAKGLRHFLKTKWC